jgi:hypothetical protein
MRVVSYESGMAALWDAHVDTSRNGTFLIKRGYMDYHADRFVDVSAVVFDGSTVVAAFPASQHGSKIISHGGLTYGGLIMGSSIRQKDIIDVFARLSEHYRSCGNDSVVYKAIPKIFHRYPAEDDLYALSRIGASLIRRDASTAVFLPERIGYTDQRKRNIKKAIKSGVIVSEDRNFEAFIELLTVVLKKHGATPTHSADELSLLASRFPGQIRLYVARIDTQIVAGVLVYEKGHSVHTQYLAASDVGRENGALDFLLAHLLDNEYASRRYFSFGISTEQAGTILNEGLIAQKEGFGGRTVVHDFYEWIL